MATNGFNPELDKVLVEVGTIESKDDDLSVRVVSYNDGPKKVAVNRSYFTRKGEPRTKAMGRLSSDELAALIPLLTKAQKELKG
jgi:hypothetical protein